MFTGESGRNLWLVRGWVRALHVSDQRVPLLQQLILPGFAQRPRQPDLLPAHELVQVDVHRLGRARTDADGALELLGQEPSLRRVR